MTFHDLLLIAAFLTIAGLTAYSQTTPDISRWLAIQTGIEP